LIDSLLPTAAYFAEPKGIRLFDTERIATPSLPCYCAFALRDSACGASVF